MPYPLGQQASWRNARGKDCDMNPLNFASSSRASLHLAAPPEGRRPFLERERERKRRRRPPRVRAGQLGFFPGRSGFFALFSSSLFFNRYKGDPTNTNTKLSLPLVFAIPFPPARALGGARAWESPPARAGDGGGPRVGTTARVKTARVGSARAQESLRLADPRAGDQRARRAVLRIAEPRQNTQILPLTRRKKNLHTTIRPRADLSRDCWIQGPKC